MEDEEFNRAVRETISFLELADLASENSVYANEERRSVILARALELAQYLVSDTWTHDIHDVLTATGMRSN
jgi:hypothetical protein